MPIRLWGSAHDLLEIAREGGILLSHMGLPCETEAKGSLNASMAS